MPPFVTKSWLNGRANGDDARLNATTMNDLEARIATAIGSGVGGGSSLHIENSGPVTGDQTLDVTNYQDVLWFVTLGADLKLQISGWSTGKSVTLVIKQDATGGRVVSQLPTAKWEGGSIPATSTAANAIDIRTFFRGLSETFGFESGTAMA
jgi:hypothetical protein